MTPYRNFPSKTSRESGRVKTRHSFMAEGWSLAIYYSMSLFYDEIHQFAVAAT